VRTLLLLLLLLRYIYNQRQCGRCRGPVKVWDMATRTVRAGPDPLLFHVACTATSLTVSIQPFMEWNLWCALRSSKCTEFLLNWFLILEYAPLPVASHQDAPMHLHVVPPEFIVAALICTLQVYCCETCQPLRLAAPNTAAAAAADGSSKPRSKARSRSAPAGALDAAAAAAGVDQDPAAAAAQLLHPSRLKSMAAAKVAKVCGLGDAQLA
jgi:hypothetical protein